jgi:hypothetical protein
MGPAEMIAQAGLGRGSEAVVEAAAGKRHFPPAPRRPFSLDRGAVEDWSCRCGQQYRVLVEPLTFWARNSRSGFRTAPTQTCVVCGDDLEEAFALEAARLMSVAILS